MEWEVAPLCTALANSPIKKRVLPCFSRSKPECQLPPSSRHNHPRVILRGIIREMAV